MMPMDIVPLNIPPPTWTLRIELLESGDPKTLEIAHRIIDSYFTPELYEMSTPVGGVVEYRLPSVGWVIDRSVFLTVEVETLGKLKVTAKDQTWERFEGRE